VRRTRPSRTPPRCGPAPERTRKDDATRARLLGELPRARWIHLATHGAYDEEPGAGGAIGGGEVQLVPLAPLVRCSLALSGANASDEGRITAEELAGVDLAHADLVVLSACDTALGLNIPGLGVASFQKAVAAAGARTSLTSLWPASDAATREWMDTFYAVLFQEGRAKDEAVATAQAALRARRASVREWAGWVLAGTRE
jgi:CHAT domain-containing protein